MTSDRMDQCRCPTCGAVQSWQEECRRCRTELGDLRRIASEIVQVRSFCLQAVRDGDWQRAERLAERLTQFSPTGFHHVLRAFIKHKMSQ